MTVGAGIGDELGLHAALQRELDRTADATGISTRLLIDRKLSRLPPEVETSCFRVALEAVLNCVRHAKATLLQVELRQRKRDVELTVRDDGSGFDPAVARRQARRGRSLGLVNIEERVALVGGQVRIESAPGRGTVLRARFRASRGRLPRGKALNH